MQTWTRNFALGDAPLGVDGWKTGLARLRSSGAGLLAALCLWPGAGFAAWTPADLDSLTQNFLARAASAFRATSYPVRFLDPARCFNEGVNCFGANPQGMYGYPAFDGNLVPTTKLKATDALVLIMETPPPMRYFGVTPYLMTRFYASLPNNPSQSGFVPVFESLTDSINDRNVATAGSPTPGQVPFSQLSVFVMTADATTYAKVVNQFKALGFPVTAINLLAMPIDVVPLNMGSSPTSDKYTVLIRAAYPDSDAALADYMRRLPVRTLRLTPLSARAVSPLPPPTSKVPGSGTLESAELAQARDQLANQLVSAYSAGHAVTEKKVVLLQTQNYWCIDLGASCNGDNPDGLYAVDMRSFVPKSRADKILIVGIDHVSTGKATYVSHAADNDANDTGVVAADNVWLHGSALVMGNVNGPGDPRYALYSQLYAFTMSYDCTGERVCVQIPEPTPANPVGIVFGDPFSVGARYYVDPATNTRPAIGEVIPHRVFKMLKH
jgi:hypothetical protein